MPQDIIAISSVNSTNSTGPGNNIAKVPQDPAQSRKLGAGATAGIVIAALAGCALIIGAFTLWFLRRRKSRKSRDDSSSDKPEMDGSSAPPMSELYDANGTRKKLDPELQGSDPNLALDEKTGKPKLEMHGSQGGVEMEGSRPHLEMQGSEGGVEMEGNHGAAEMSAHPPEVHELPADYGHRELSAEREDVAHASRSQPPRRGPTPRRRSDSRRESKRWSFISGRG